MATVFPRITSDNVQIVYSRSDSSGYAGEAIRPLIVSVSVINLSHAFLVLPFGTASLAATSVTASGG
jgi:hypothetical protein